MRSDLHWNPFCTSSWMRIIRNASTARPWATSTARVILIWPEPTTGTAALATDGTGSSWTFVYTPRGEPFSVDPNSLKGPKFTEHWFDPGTSEVQSVATLDQSFNPPGEPDAGTDWILMLVCPQP